MEYHITFYVFYFHRPCHRFNIFDVTLYETWTEHCLKAPLSFPLIILANYSNLPHICFYHQTPGRVGLHADVICTCTWPQTRILFVQRWDQRLVRVYGDSFRPLFTYFDPFLKLSKCNIFNLIITSLAVN